MADSYLLHCNIAVQRSELVQKAANGKNHPGHWWAGRSRPVAGVSEAPENASLGTQ